jgi:hypothetical protein
MAWYERCLALSRWPLHGRSMTEEYVAETLKIAQDLHTDALLFGVQLGGYVCYPSKVSPCIPGLKIDVLRQLVSQSHQIGLKIVPWWLGTVPGCAYEALQHPDWVQKGPDGGWVDPNYARMCYNSPYRDYLFAQVREVVRNYEVDGIYFDQLPSACYCSYCQEKFERQYGVPMSIDPQAKVTDPWFVLSNPGLPQAELLEEFQQESVRSFCANIRRIIDETRPGVVYIQCYLSGVRAELGEPYVDVFLPELYVHSDVPLYGLSMSNRLTGAYGRKPVWNFIRHAVSHDARVNPAIQTITCFGDWLADGCVPVLEELGAIDDNRNGYQELQIACQQTKLVQEALGGSQPLRYCALLHSKASERHYRSDHTESFAGFYHLLVEQHIPFEVITERMVGDGELGEYKALILPNAVCLSDGTVEKIVDFVEGGGGLVMTFLSGHCDEDGQRKHRNRLAELAGYDFVGVVSREQGKVVIPSIDAQVPIPSVDVKPRVHALMFHYARVTGNHAVGEAAARSLLWFTGGYVETTCSQGCDVVARVLAMDQGRVNMEAFNRRGLFPGQETWPFILTRETKGRAAFITGQVGPEWRRIECPQIDLLLAGAIRWVGRDALPFEVANCPGSVKVSGRQDSAQGILTLVLANLTTNPTSYGVIKYVVPVRDIGVRLRVGSRSVRSVRSVTGTQIGYRRDGEWLALDVPKLEAFEGIVVETEVTG